MSTETILGPDGLPHLYVTRQTYAIECCDGDTELRARCERLQRDHDQMLANLTETQARCTELLEENRSLKYHADLKTVEKARMFERFHIVAWLSTIDYGMYNRAAHRIENGEHLK